MEEVRLSAILDLGVAVQKLTGEIESGDLHLVKPFQNGILVAVIDGLGHGPSAAEASRVAAETLESFPEKSLNSLIERCHQSLRGTRGAAITLASFNTYNGTMSWLGVGNVEGVLFHHVINFGQTMKSLLLHPGIVGCNLPQLHVRTIPVIPGDTLILVSDGIRYNFARSIPLSHSPQDIADRIITNHAKDNDDATVLVARYLGGTK
jgi:negative regulator of sigma-B (phosphoserine phosphatase)